MEDYSLNDASIVPRLGHGEVSFLLIDRERTEETEERVRGLIDKLRDKTERMDEA